jgi:hypothetical protein
MNRLALLAAAAALAAPSAGVPALVEHGRGRGIGDWLRANNKSRQPRPITRRAVMALQLRGWPEIPCEAPPGYFWSRAASGAQRWYLRKSPPGERHVEYDAANDRSIIRSGWGYVKPTYAPGDVRGR